jgi:hypothetical protein
VIEDYWMKLLQNSDIIGEHIEPDDEKALKHIVKIEASKTEDGTNLTVIFHFSENEWFNNKSIKKEF